MAQRVWEQVQETFEALFFDDKKFQIPKDDNRAAPDRTRNAFVSDKYEYSPLTEGRKSVRLLELLPGTRQQDIACILTEYFLADRFGTYDALSYVWGDTATLTPIQISGRTLMVTENLRTALLNIRKLDQPCTLWVDAVCINQGDKLERGHQVSIMHDIYRNAARTIVWLGDNRPPLTKQAFAMVDELVAEAVSLRSAGAEMSSSYSLSSLLGAERVESPSFDRFRDDFSIIHLACAGWWLRTWTVQEVLLASQAVVMAGTYTMDWDRFSSGIDHGFRIGIWNPVLLGIVLDPIVVPYLSMSALRRQRLSSSRPSTTAPAQTLLKLLIECRFRHASDPRDKVYGLLGLKDDASQSSQASALGIEPDYTLSTSQVYRHTARQLLLELDNLDVLGASTTTADLDLPSWVPDWRITASGPHPLMHDALGRPRQTHASRGTQAAPRFLDDGDVLVLTGHEVLTITRLAPVLRRVRRANSELTIIKRGDTLLERLSALGQLFAHLARVYWELSSVVPHLATFQEWEALARERPPPLSQQQDNMASSSSSSSPSTGSLESPPVGEEGGYDPLSVYWQTLCAGTLAPGGREATAQLFYSWRASLRAIFRLHEWRVDSLLRPLAFVGYLMQTWRAFSEFAGLLEHVYERRLGRAEEDCSLVLLPEGAEIGDRVVLVKGGRQPLVLRRDGGGGGSGGQGQYKFVGEAYVHGLMDGERFEEGKCIEMRIR